MTTEDAGAALAELEQVKAELAKARSDQERHERQWRGLREISALLDAKPPSDAEDLVRLVKDHVSKLLQRDGRLKQALAHHLLIAEAMEESQERTQAALDSINTGVLIANPQDGLVVEANAVAANIVGTTAEQLPGTPLDKIFGHAGVSQDAALEFEGELFRSDGERIDVLRGSRLITAGERVYQMETFADITGRDKYRRMLETRSRMLSGLAAAVNNLLRGGDFETDVRACMGLLGKAAEVDRIYLFEDSPGAFQRGLGAQERYRWADAGASSPNAPDCSVLRAAFCQGEQGAVAFGQFLVAPIFLAGRYRGFMGFETLRQPRRWSTMEISIVKTAAETFGAALDLRKAEEELGKALSRSEVLRLEAQYCAIRATEGKMAAEAGTLARTEFLGLISDEMRNPLNGVIGMSDLLRDTPLNHEQTEYVDTIRESGSNLLVLIDDVLDFTKAESGELKLKEQAFELAWLVAEAAGTFKANAEEKGLGLDWELGPGCPRRIVGDRDRLLQVLRSLLRNAVEFTRRGHVAVHVVNNGGLLTFTVQDSGVGIAPDQLGKLFKPLNKLDCSASRRHKGLGLGLALASRLVKLMGGGMAVESQPGVGSKFMFSLAAQEVGGVDDDDEPVSDEAGDQLPEERRGLKILVAEDNKINQRLVALALTKLGSKPDLAENGEKALEAAAKTKYDIIFMDLHMPGMGGLEAARLILAGAPPGQSPVIVAMTANVSQEDRELCRKAGMADFIPKPIRPERLRAALRRWGTARPNDETLVAQEVTLDNGDAALLNPGAIATLKEMDVLEEMVGLFVEDEAPACMKQIRSVIQKGGFDLLKQAAHSLKGISYHVGAEHLGERCKLLEDAAAAKDRQRARSLLETLEASYAGTCEALAKLKGA